jgi:hypothetical protein
MFVCGMGSVSKAGRIIPTPVGYPMDRRHRIPVDGQSHRRGLGGVACSPLYSTAVALRRSISARMTRAFGSTPL